MVFRELAPPQAHKIKNRNDLESELFGASNEGHNADLIRDNEGEAAEQGIYFDDTEYDYMQHIRGLNAGDGNGESFFVEASVGKNKKGKNKMSLEEALRESSLHDPQSVAGDSTAAESLLDDDMLPSLNLKAKSYLDQQDVPDTLAGFQPDMDPRLREVLEALNDDAYVDDEEDFIGEIAKDGREVSREEFEDAQIDDEEQEDDGWESDTTEKPIQESQAVNPSSIDPSPSDLETEVSMPDQPIGDAADHGDGEWMKEFSKYKQDQKTNKAHPRLHKPDMQSSIITGSSMTGRKKKRKGAMTSSTGYSMTSSALQRTEGHTLLDARFDKIEEEYAGDSGDMAMPDDDDTASIMTKSSRASKDSMASSQAPSLVRADFDNIMDDFLGGYSMQGKRNKRVKKGGYQTGLEQLDEVRKGLGPARLKPQKAS